MKNVYLTIFYDGFCPLCLAEMNKLKALDQSNLLGFVDIQDESFTHQYPHLVWSDLNARIHGCLDDGSLISGLDVTYLAWKLVGKGWLYAPLRWPGVRWLADVFYNVFAKHRYSISYLLTGKKRCAPCEVITKRSNKGHSDG